MKCVFLFKHSQRPRHTCGLPAGADGLCVFHSPTLLPGFIDALVKEVAKHDHWLEGAQIKEDLVEVGLSSARLPRANFEGRRLVRVALDSALLEDANFRSAIIEGTLLQGSNLRRAAFDAATLQSTEDSVIDFSNTELGGASFTGATLKSLRLVGSRFSEPTSVAHLLDTPCFEMEVAAWEDAASVYSTLGKRAGEDWDFISEELCAYLAMTCRHRKAIGAGPLQKERSSHNWIGPSLAAGMAGIGWALHREVWGYGLRPLRVFVAMVVLIAFFGLFVFPFVGVAQSNSPSSSPFIDGLVLSLSTFVTLTYGRHGPTTTVGEIAGGIEALLGNILLSLFLVALAGKYVRRF
jgi:hypothetical protein